MGVSPRGELPSREDASHGDGANKVPAQEAGEVPAMKAVAVQCNRIQHLGSGREKARQSPRSTN